MSPVARLILATAPLAAASLQLGEQIGNVTGSPTWKLLLLDHADGLVAIDTNGQAVWTCANCGEAKDQLPNGNLVTVVRGTGLVERDADCNNVAQSSLPADGHEARIDGIDLNRVLGITNGCVGSSPGCQAVLHWDRSTGVDSKALDLGDYFNATEDWGYLSTDADWMHTNCVSTGVHNNILVGIRHLSTIASFDYTTKALQWRWSSEIFSNFTFDAEDSKFYNCHDAHQLPNGNILLFDNGNKRNGAPASSSSLSATGRCSDQVNALCPSTSATDCEACVFAHNETLQRVCKNYPHDAIQACGAAPSPTPSPAPSPTPSPAPTPTPAPGAYSRAAEYALDFETMRATLVFEFRVTASHAQGGARRLDNGNTLVTCPECSTRSADDPRFPGGVVYEVDTSAVEVSRVDVGAKIYRAQAIDSIGQMFVA